MYQSSSMQTRNSFCEGSHSHALYSNPSSDHSKESSRSFKNANLQEIFLNNCRKNENTVNVDLLAGERRRGVIIGFDNQSVILSENNTQRLIYKNAISTIIPDEEVQYIFSELLKKEYSDSFNHVRNLQASPEKAGHNS